MSHQLPASASPQGPDSLFGTLLRFARRPFYPPTLSTDQRPKAILGEILRIYSVALALLMPLLAIITLVTSSLDAEDHPISNYLETLPVYAIFLTAVIIAPLLEEFIFRLPLRYSPFNVAVPLAFLSLLAPLPLVSEPLAAGIKLLLSTVIGIGGWFVLHHWVLRQQGHAFYTKYIGWFVYSTTVLFGAIHIFNFDEKLLYVAPLVVMPQCTLGLFFAFIRLKHGFWWAVFSHALHNFCLLLPYSLMQLGSPSLQDGKATELLFPTDYILLTIVFVFVGGGLFLCLRSVFRTIREWQLERQKPLQDI